MLLCSFVGVGRLSVWFGVVVCNSSITSEMFVGVMYLLSGPNLFFVVIGGLIGVVLWLCFIMCLCGDFCHSWFGMLFMASSVSSGRRG